MKKRMNNPSSIYRRASNAIEKVTAEPQIQIWHACLINWQWHII